MSPVSAQISQDRRDQEETQAETPQTVQPPAHVCYQTHPSPTRLSRGTGVCGERGDGVEGKNGSGGSWKCCQAQHGNASLSSSNVMILLQISISSTF